ncbi:DUF3040 domain-containing protein [Agrococcus lahaulensis]|jgi:hypothetical protein|uniref:DUF3040 domain-containing protein n=1 Tax=Agrococcus TaxID=46352 RepID=UPI000FE3C547|nr:MULTISPECIES: DUF3040 domain-containing protein [unclassified Agrococcus]MDR7234932.1 hypothetical protein [Agrococcus sp. BE272]RWR25742.1 DUF3040 domain-containing protein [Agrococcus lahaulensis]UOW00209.1 DUF3040 domain-containing protein [Agrococcus sp. SCSIO52902]
MGLSEHEQRLLDEMERNLYKHEADIVTASSGPRTVDYTKVAVGVLGIAIGLVLIVVGVSMKLAVLGVLGFGVAVAGALWALSASKPATGDDVAPGARPSEGPASAKQGPNLMDRLAQEWDDRNQRG